MSTISLASVALGQGPMFWHAGADLLRSKSFDANSFNSGDWFNRIDWTGQTSTFGSGLPPAASNSAKYPYMTPLLGDPARKPGPADIAAAAKASQQLLKLRYSSPLFRLGSAALIQQKVAFLTSGPSQAPGVIAMQLDDRVGPDVDPALQRVVVVFNASAAPATVAVAGASGLHLSPIQAAGADPVVKQTTTAAGSVTVPARTVAVLVQ
jgi:pullulanase/glycogen debranching enzyme